MTEQTIKTSCWDTDQDEEEEVEEVYPDQQCSRTVPVSLAYRGRRSRKEVEQRVTSSSTSLSSPISIIPSPIQSPLSIFPSPLSVLPSPSPVSGPLSAPATFSWGKQSPIPHRNSPLHSPFLLSPGQEHFPPSLAPYPICGYDPPACDAPGTAGLLAAVQTVHSRWHCRGPAADHRDRDGAGQGDGHEPADRRPTAAATSSQ